MSPAALLAAALQAQQRGAGGGMLGDGAGIALAGMTTVFTGLVVLAILLPLLRRAAEGRGGRDPGRESDEGSGELSPEQVVAVTAAVHAHLALLDRMESMKLTWESYERPYTPWRLAGRAEHLQGTETVRNRSRSTQDARVQG